MQSFLDAIEAKDFAALPSYFCEEFADQASTFDLTTLAGTLPEGTDAQALLDAFILDAEVTNLEVVSQTDTRGRRGARRDASRWTSTRPRWHPSSRACWRPPGRR